MSYQFRLLGTLAMLFKATALFELAVATFAGVFMARSDLLLPGLGAFVAGAFAALVTYSIGSLIDLARACEAHLRAIANESEWVPVAT